uniref:Uncharacterized protein n=1 Tax=Arundo donax TaxID=35708 RepID=A0A0A8YQG4_ARUDO
MEDSHYQNSETRFRYQ